jgi:uncharacterized phiE125 gp8 family phage protein
VSPPTNSDRYYGGFRITYKAGYGDAPGDVPQNIREAIKMWATELYENRAVGTLPSPDSRKLLASHRVIK